MSSHPAPTPRHMLAATLLVLAPCPLGAQNLMISGLADVAFGTLPTPGADQTKAQSVCAYSGLLGGRYSVSATGSGTGGAFTLANGTYEMPYEVQWSASAGQTTGTALTSGTSITGRTGALSCPTLAASNASLILLIRSAAIAEARAGSYSGTLTILLSPN